MGQGSETWGGTADRCVLQAVIGTIGDIDSYQLPDAKGSSAFSDHILGNTHEKRQARREEVLGTSLQDFRYSPWPLHLPSCNPLVASDTAAVSLESHQAQAAGQRLVPRGGWFHVQLRQLSGPVSS